MSCRIACLSQPRLVNSDAFGRSWESRYMCVVGECETELVSVWVHLIAVLLPRLYAVRTFATECRSARKDAHIL